MEIAKIREAAPVGAEFFAPAPQWVGGAFYFKEYGDRILMQDMNKQWVFACETVEELFDHGGLPLSYEPIDWIKKLEKN